MYLPYNSMQYHTFDFQELITPNQEYQSLYPAFHIILKLLPRSINKPKYEKRL